MRDARPGDRRAVFAFTSRTWGQYGDFIPQVWDRWIAHKAGRMIVAELDRVPVGLAKITDFGKGELWLEGLRVDPAYRGRGIARALNVEVVRTLARMHPRTVRYCTGSRNWASRHIGGRFGFKIAARLRHFWAKPRRGRPKGEFARARDADAVYDFVRASRFLKLSAGLVAEGWVFREFNRKLLDGYIAAKRVMVIRGREGLAGVAIYPTEREDGALTLGFVDGTPPALRALARNCRYLAARRKDTECSIEVPSSRFPKLIESAGYRRKESMGMVVMQYADLEVLARGLGRPPPSYGAGKGAGDAPA
jgi:ribosomal protein S18 acetylase RimI-like enzyme